MPVNGPDQFTDFTTTVVAGGAGGIGTNLGSADTTVWLPAGFIAAHYPSSYPYYITIGDDSTFAGSEIVKVTALAGTDHLTIVRNIGGTNQVWALGAPLRQTLSSINVNNLWSASPMVFNVRGPLFGATGNGVTDDTVAILAAISAATTAGGGTVYLPAGTYLVSGNHGTAAGGSTSLVLPAAGNITVQGDGMGQTTIKHAGGNVNVMAAGTGSATPNITVRNLTINGNGCTGYGLIVQYADHCLFENVEVFGANALTTCIAVYDSNNGKNTLINCRVNGGGSSCLQGFEMGYGETGTRMIGCLAVACLNGFQFDAGVNGLSGLNHNQQCVLVDCEAYFNLSGGFNLEDMQDCQLVNCVANGNTHFGVATSIVNITAATSRLRIVGGSYRLNGNGTAGNAGIWLLGNRSAVTDADICNNNPIGLRLTSCSTTQVTSNQFWDDQGSPTQATNISVDTANTWAGLCAGNRFEANASNLGGAGTTTATQIGNQGLNWVLQTSVTVTASPFTYTNTSGRPQMVLINGGTVSAVSFKRGAGATLGVFTASNNSIWVGPGDLIIVTYSVLPTITTIDM